MSKNEYQKQGYVSRQEYLESLAKEYGVDEYIVLSLAEVLGPNEDFDGLVNELNDLYL